MNKFYILVIMNDLKLVKMWADNDIVIRVMHESTTSKVYRYANDQEAVLLDDDKVVWRDVPIVEYINAAKK